MKHSLLTSDSWQNLPGRTLAQYQSVSAAAVTFVLQLSFALANTYSAGPVHFASMAKIVTLSIHTLSISCSAAGPHGILHEVIGAR